MANTITQTDANWNANIGSSPLEAKLRPLLTEQRQLRDLLEQTRAELDRVNGEVLRLNEEYCSDPSREAEYFHCLQQILGFDARLDAKEIEEGLKDPQSLRDFLAELEGLRQ